MNNSSAVSGVQIRLAADGDQGAVRALGKALWYGGDAQPSARVDAIFTKYWEESYLRALCVMPNCTFVVAHHDSHFVGMAMASTTSSEPHRAKLSRFCLLPEYKGKGIELLLLRHCEAQLRQLMTCVPQNDTAQRHWLADAGFIPECVFQIDDAPQPFLEMVKWIERDAPTPRDVLSAKQALWQNLSQQAPLNLN